MHKIATTFKVRKSLTRVHVVWQEQNEKKRFITEQASHVIVVVVATVKLSKMIAGSH